nr:hypothetical protein [Tanacetum cinerariifolium]
MDVDSVNFLYLLARNLRRFALGRKHGIYDELDDTWALVAQGPERQPDAAAGALEGVEGATNVDEGAHAIPALVRASHPPLAAVPTRTKIQRMTSLSMMMDVSEVRYTSYSDFWIPYQRHTRRTTDNASTSAPQQPDA